MFTVKRVVIFTVFAMQIGAVAADIHAQSGGNCGLMVLAHGGTDEWNSNVEAAVSPLRDSIPTAIAFGMANPATLKSAVAALEELGVECIVGVGLFVSAQSFRHQNEYLLGLREDAPSWFISHGGVHSNIPSPLTFSADIRLNNEGLLDAPEMGQVLKRRVLALSNHSGSEAVIVIAHGPDDDDENDEWLRKLDLLADSVRATELFSAVVVHTLREDWKSKRADAEQRIRAFVKTHSQDGGRVLVIPFRLSGFGPYTKVLEGLTYEASGEGLLPSPSISDWIGAQYQKAVVDAGWAKSTRDD